jgi:hypothetical protein
MGASESLDKAEKAGNFLTGLLAAVREHPYVFLFVIAALTLLISFLPNGSVKAYIEHRTEMRKLNARVNEGKRKLIASRQNRRKR